VRAFRISAAALLSAALSGCGFHLAGDEPLPEPMRSVYIEVIDPYHVSVPPLEAALQARITRSGGEVTSKIEQAKTVLRLSDLSETQEVLSIGPDGLAIEYRLVARVTYEVLSGKNLLIPPQSQGLDRAYSFNATQILPKEAEAARLSTFIQNELADVVLLRIQAQLKHSQSAPSPASAEVPATDQSPQPELTAPVTPPSTGPASSADIPPAP